MGAHIMRHMSDRAGTHYLGQPEALSLLRNPGIGTIPLAFLVPVGVSLVAPVRDEEERFVGAERRLHVGVE